MKSLNWTLEQLRSELSHRKEVKAWIVTEEHFNRRERYFLSEEGKLATDQDRNVKGRNVSLRLFVYLQKPGRHGEITKKIFASLPLKTQIDQAIHAALQTDHQAWDLPSKINVELPHLLTADPRMAEDLDGVVEELTSKIEASVNEKRNSQFNSSELFLSVHDQQLYLSNGLTYRSSQTRIYVETAFSFGRLENDGKFHSDEYLSTQWAVGLNQLSIEKMFNEAAHNAENSLDVTKPNTGKYSVIVDADVLAQLLSGHLLQLSASNAYNGLPFIKIGEDFIPAANGDFLTITLDPTLSYGANTVVVSEQGLLQRPLKLVDLNKVVATSADKQYGDYLGLASSTVRGNIVVEPGSLNFEELTQQAPQVIEILQFSGLFSDPNSGTFSSEIRLAKLYDNERKKVTYLKGGCLSGSISENFRGLRLSKNQTTRAHFSSESSIGRGYFGPEYALLSNVSIVG